MIVLDSHFIQLPVHFSFLQAVDYVFRLHIIFDIEYDNNLRLFWCFIEKYIYNLEVNNIPNTVKLLYIKLSKLVSNN